MQHSNIYKLPKQFRFVISVADIMSFIMTKPWDFSYRLCHYNVYWMKTKPIWFIIQAIADTTNFMMTDFTFCHICFCDN